ncbi:MAG: hypothetical protein MJ166_07205 [Clostridia bacterium]|nr:hypothetical protein [Clostridia bacterium]
MAKKNKHKKNVNVDVNTEPKKVKTAKSHSNKKARAGISAIRNSIFAVVGVVVAVVVMLVVIKILFDSIAAKPAVQFITTGRVEHTIGATAIIVRDETVIPSKTEGDLVTKATEGSRVATSQQLALIVPDNMSSVVTNLRNTQSQISEVQQEVIASGKAQGASQIFKNVDEDISPIVDLLRVDSMNGNLSDLSSFESSISVLIDGREKDLAKIEFDDESLSILRSDAASYENQLSKSSAIVTAPCPGIISYKLDGQEEELSFDYLLTANPDEINNKIESSTGVITSDMTISKGENVARISQNEEQYLAVVLRGKDVNAVDFKLESKHNINVASEGVTIDNCVVVRSEPCDDGLLVVFSTTRHVESLMDLRTVNIEIVINSTTGLHVPVSCLVEPDYKRGVATIYVNEDGFVLEVKVFIDDYDREFAIIRPFTEGDKHPTTKSVIITNPTVTKPGEKVN